MEIKNNSDMYITVLKNLSKGSAVQNEVDFLIKDFSLKIKKQGENSTNYWQARAYKDFHDILSNKIKELQTMQTNCINSIFFKLEN